jgi:spore germination protein GerM
MKKNIILSAALILLCFSVIYILNTRGITTDLNNKLVLQEKEIDASTLSLRQAEKEIDELTLNLSHSKNEIENLTSNLSQSEQINEKRKARIEQLTRGYPSGVWECDNDANRIVFMQEIKNPTLNIIISALNDFSISHDEPTINFLKQHKSNVDITVNDSEQLTERMGSAGANCFLGKVVYSITSIEGIDSVTFKFEEGSHAVPGKYSRIDFEP